MAITFLTSLVLTSLIMSAIALLLLFFFTARAHVTTAKTRYFIWVIVFIGLIIPFRPIFGPGVVIIDWPIKQSVSTIEPSIQMAESQKQKVDTGLEKAGFDSKAISAGTLIFIIWAIGAITVFTWHIGKYFRFRKLINRWSSNVSNKKILDLLHMSKSQLGLSNKRIDVSTCDFISSPMLVGIIRPTILLPRKEMDEDELTLILKHELTHCKHNDLLVKLLGIIAISIHWFNPIVYLCCLWAQTDVEAYCDEAVLAHADINSRRYYGEVIIAMIGNKSKMQTILSTGFCSGKFDMKRRLYAIMDTNKKRKNINFLAIALVTLLTVSSGSFIAFAQSNTDTLIGVEKAKTIAIEHAKVKSSKVNFVKAKLDTDGGRYEYDIEFYIGNIEYDYEINAGTGKILEHDRDIEYFSIRNHKQPMPPVTPKSRNVITEAKAKSIALVHAGLKESEVSFIKLRLDYDDGRATYDVEFKSGGIEYEYEIGALSGNILEWDRDYEEIR